MDKLFMDLVVLCMTSAKARVVINTIHISLLLMAILISGYIAIVQLVWTVFCFVMVHRNRDVIFQLEYKRRLENV